MKTIGERIRQARDALKMSGADLAARAGYKNQSAIGNLENRAGGAGGRKIYRIASALRVPVDWLLQGPDSDNVPFLPGAIDAPMPPPVDEVPRAEIHALPLNFGPDPVLREANELLLRMSLAGREQAIGYLRFLATQHAAAPRSIGGESDSVPHPRGA